ncbi:MAG: hypothetical protein V4693_20255 [Pseudomonadota bacterium]
MSTDKWSDKEKKVARRAFDIALERERDALLAEFKLKAVAANNFDDLWEIRQYLKERLNGVDSKYDYRYSQLIYVFGFLLREKRVTEEELAGIAEEKLKLIRAVATDW